MQGNWGPLQKFVGKLLKIFGIKVASSANSNLWPISIIRRDFSRIGQNFNEYSTQKLDFFIRIFRTKNESSLQQ
jgi:hypothetical protein